MKECIGRHNISFLSSSSIDTLQGHVDVHNSSFIITKSVTVAKAWIVKGFYVIKMKGFEGLSTG